VIPPNLAQINANLSRPLFPPMMAGPNIINYQNPMIQNQLYENIRKKVLQNIAQNNLQPHPNNLNPLQR